MQRAELLFPPLPVAPSDPAGSLPEYILGTVHKAKGLEFDTVHVLDDFVKVPCARHNLAQLPHFRVGKTPASSLGGPCLGVPCGRCLAFSWMVWPLARILLEQKSPSS